MSGRQLQRGCRQGLEKHMCIRLALRNAAATTWELVDPPEMMGDARPSDPLTPANHQPVSSHLSNTEVNRLTTC